MTYLIVFIAVFVGAWLGVGVFLKWSERKSILDVPNERSSHAVPTPVGGGVVIVFFTLFGFLLFELIENGVPRFWSVYAGGFAVAVVSWLDDLNPIPAFFRIAVHTIAACMVIYQFGAIYSLGYEGFFILRLGPFAWLISLLWIVWMTNAYNFMDGIDGLAGLQAVIAAAGWLVLAVTVGANDVEFIALLVMAAATGFLVYNWPPAKVFMGDVGSAFLGFVFAIMPLIAIQGTVDKGLKSFLPLAAVGFLWLFGADTILTFIRRLFSREKVWVPHRSHIYQEMIKSGYSHFSVTVIYGILSAAIAGLVIIELKTSIYGFFVPAGALTTSALFLFANRQKA